ncbi:MAG: carbohydrate-binding family 9-like protein, partial [Pseudomonadota bacterium]
TQHHALTAPRSMLLEKYRRDTHSATVHFARTRPDLTGAWDSPAWAQADTLEAAQFRPEGSSHCPRTRIRLLYDKSGMYGIFRVEDRYVRCVRTGYMDEVYKDSCAEYFVRPHRAQGYFAFEFNCGGTLRSSYIVDPTRVGGGFKECIPLPEEEASCVAVYHSLPAVVDPEIQVPVVWTLEFFIPFSLFEKYAGPLGSMAGQHWRANFFKCGDETSHPHWASWAALDERNFHLPHCFGVIEFKGAVKD